VSAYINEKVQFHLQNAFLDEPTEDSLIGMLSYMGLMHDPRASKDMVPEEVWMEIREFTRLIARKRVQLMVTLCIKRETVKETAYIRRSAPNDIVIKENLFPLF
jgi:hypothetical protein